MIVDGKQIARDIEVKLKAEFAKRETPAVLAVMLVGDDPASKKFVELKEKKAVELGVEFRLCEYEPTIETEDLLSELRRLNTDRDITGIVIQLPLPKHVDAETVLAAIDPSKDIDALGPDARAIAPVTGAILEIFKHHGVEVAGKKTVVVGSGRLVGQPTGIALVREGADVVMANSSTKDLVSILKTADIVISGAGSPGIITPEMLKEGVVLVDAGTSESSGKFAGDADPRCAEKASLFTPVPGGVGPVTVAILFRNLFALSHE
ncbi:MAG: bifunctional 5,10-methylenetetrahydrofolate dehydrogenase/5,10-methenyltetrahydrofolate cyclohydrolase [Patescibacteria group bacterium]